MSEVDKALETPVSSELETAEELVSIAPAEAVDEVEKVFAEAKAEKEASLLPNDIKDEPKAEKELSPIEKEAIAMGWRAADKFDTSTEGKRFISAEEFVERGQLFKKIDHQKTELQQLKNVVKDMSEHYKQTEELAYNRAMTTILAARNKAVEEGDIENFKLLDNQMFDLNRQAVQSLQERTPNPQAQTSVEAKPISPDAQTFYDRNKHWFNNDTMENKQMVTFALAADEFMAIRRPDLSEKDRISLVEADVRRAFTHRFENTNRDAPPTVATKTSDTSGARGTTLISKLSHRQRALAKEMIEHNLYNSIEEYAKDLASRGVI